MTKQNHNRENIKNRYLTVGGSYSHDNKYVSWLRLKGKWLEKAGFKEGDKVEVVVRKGVLLIVPK